MKLWGAVTYVGLNFNIIVTNRRETLFADLGKSVTFVFKFVCLFDLDFIPSYLKVIQRNINWNRCAPQCMKVPIVDANIRHFTWFPTYGVIGPLTTCALQSVLSDTEPAILLYSSDRWKGWSCKNLHLFAQSLVFHRWRFQRVTHRTRVNHLLGKISLFSYILFKIYFEFQFDTVNELSAVIVSKFKPYYIFHFHNALER